MNFNIKNDYQNILSTLQLNNISFTKNNTNQSHISCFNNSFNDNNKCTYQFQKFTEGNSTDYNLDQYFKHQDYQKVDQIKLKQNYADDEIRNPLNLSFQYLQKKNKKLSEKVVSQFEDSNKDLYKRIKIMVDQLKSKDLENQNINNNSQKIKIKMQQEDSLVSGSNQSNNIQQKDPNLKNLQIQYKLRLESLTKQYQLKLEKQNQLHCLQIWRLKQDLETLNMQIKNSKSNINLIKFQDSASTCTLCSNGQVIKGFQKILQNLSQDHDGCLNEKRLYTLRNSELQRQLIQLKQILEKRNNQINQLSKVIQDKQTIIKKLEYSIQDFKIKIEKENNQANIVNTAVENFKKIKQQDLVMRKTSNYQNNPHSVFLSNQNNNNFIIQSKNKTSLAQMNQTMNKIQKKNEEIRNRRFQQKKVNKMNVERDGFSVMETTFRPRQAYKYNL